MSNEKKAKKKNFFRTVLYFLSGGILKGDFFTKHIGMIVLVAALFLLYIGNRFSCLLKVREIDRLQKELREVKNQAIAISVELTGSNRLSEIEQMIESKNIGLESYSEPPYIIYK